MYRVWDYDKGHHIGFRTRIRFIQGLDYNEGYKGFRD